MRFLQRDTVWLTRLYIFFFIEVGSRRVPLAGCTYNTGRIGFIQRAKTLGLLLAQIRPLIESPQADVAAGA